MTTGANPFFKKVHNTKKRMPLVLDECFEYEWLRNDLNKTSIEELMKVGFTSKKFEAYPVTEDIYKLKYFANNPNILRKINY